jgi:hypothetical protein
MKKQQYCPLHHRWFNACCWECEEDWETVEEKEQRRLETYRNAEEDEQRIERI